MSTIYFHQQLQGKILGLIEAEKERIASGQYTELTVYREQVGYLRALKDVLTLAQEIEEGLT